ncbi:hypothetical protein Anapl_01519 [Anas platyrhynchos]|uniref:Uncharacterized protein n=1 Tax=Anas platyrhynchos TaxID=8839 RepID=R0JWY6_ANAPL|nr:hypothetical protein Anapl_01519 [Anas platyrhynchos]
MGRLFILSPSSPHTPNSSRDDLAASTYHPPADIHPQLASAPPAASCHSCIPRAQITTRSLAEHQRSEFSCLINFGRHEKKSWTVPSCCASSQHREDAALPKRAPGSRNKGSEGTRRSHTTTRSPLGLERAELCSQQLSQEFPHPTSQGTLKGKGGISSKTNKAP